MAGYTHGIPTSVQIENFWDTVMPLPWSGCWIWMGRVTERGYGALGTRLRAHRVAYELAKGPIPKGKIICHTCDVPLCVNPDHLFVGSWADNIHDMINKGRDRMIGRPRKHKSPEGRIFGSWTVSSISKINGNKRLWLCKCSCGTERFVYDHDLCIGKTKGCGHARA